jgi:hypothetical protein
MQYEFGDFFWAFFGRILIKPIVLICLTILMVVEAYYLIAPAKDPLPAARSKLAERVCSKAVLELPKRTDSPSVAVLNIAGDANGAVTRLLREKVSTAGSYRVLEDRFLGKLMKEFRKENAPISNLSDAVATARQLGVDFVLFGEIADFSVNENGSNMTLDMRMAERQSGQAVFARSFSEGSPSLTSSWRLSITERPWARKVFIWLLFTLLLPLASIPLIKRLIAIDSNMLNLAMLAGYTIADMLIACLLTGFSFEGITTIALLILALAGSAVYNYSVAAFVEQMEH